MDIVLERRIQSLLSTLDPASPISSSLKLLLEDFRRSKRCKSTRFSYVTSSDGLPQTNLMEIVESTTNRRRFMATLTIGMPWPDKENSSKMLLKDHGIIEKQNVTHIVKSVELVLFSFFLTGFSKRCF